MISERRIPDPHADERSMLEGWLEYHRQTLAWKCEGLTDDQLRTAAVAPSTLSLMGLVRHVSEVERFWFRKVLMADDPGTLYHSDIDRAHQFRLTEADVWQDAYDTWQEEVTIARLNASGFALDGVSKAGFAVTGGHVSLRYIYTHMIEEYARHNGHADLLRESLDGATGD